MCRTRDISSDGRSIYVYDGVHVVIMPLYIVTYSLYIKPCFNTGVSLYSITSLAHVVSFISAADMCQNQPQFIPHPYNCHKFVQCANSAVANVLPCQPAENVFDPTSVAANCAPLADIACAEPVTKGMCKPHSVC